MIRVFSGWDPHEEVGTRVFAHSVARRSKQPVDVRPLIMADLRQRGTYTRPHEYRKGQLWDLISGAPMATQFALTRFLVPYLCGYQGWAVFADGADMVCCGDISSLMQLADPQYAVMVIQHEAYNFMNGPTTKMGEQVQTVYPRKNWSSLILWNCGHPENRYLTPSIVSSLKGLDLHNFSWLDNSLIGPLPLSWNYLVGVNDAITPIYMLHWTLGAPFLKGYENAPYADVWWSELGRMTYRSTHRVR